MQRKYVKASIVVVMSLVLVSVVSLIFAGNATAKAPRSSGQRYPEPFFSAEWRESNSQKYLEIVASDHYMLGKAQGIYLGEDIIAYNNIVLGLAVQMNISVDFLLSFIPYYLPYIPNEYLQMLQGIDDVIELNMTDLILQTIFFDVGYGQLFPLTSGNPVNPLHIGGCTAVGAKNGIFGEIIGENFDYPIVFVDCLNFVKYWVLGKSPVFNIQVGCCSWPMGKNLAVKCAGTLVETCVLGEIGIPLVIRTRMAFENCYSIDSFLNTLEGSITASFNYVMADQWGHVREIETLPVTKTVRDVQTWSATSNTFIKLEYRPYMLSQTYSVPRQAAAVELTQAAYADGRLSTSEVISILAYRDADPERCICRYWDDLPPTESAYGSGTLGFIVMEDDGGFFGMGTARDSPAGRIPSLSHWTFSLKNGGWF